MPVISTLEAARPAGPSPSGLSPDPFDRIAEVILQIRPFSRGAIGVAFAAILFGTALQTVVVLTAGAGIPSAGFFPAIAIAAILAGAPAGIVVSIVSIVLLWWAVWEPHFTFTALSAQDSAQLAWFFVSSVILVGLGLLFRKLLERAYKRQQAMNILVRELRASEARLKAAVELVGLSPYSGDPRTGALDWDARLKAMWGLPADTTVDEPMAAAAIHRDDQARVASAWEASLDPDSDGVFVAEYRVLGIEDGIERWVSTHAQNFFESRQPVGFIGAIREITQEKHAEARLRESEARLQAAVDLARLGRYACNPQTNEMQCDDTLRAMWGLAAGAPVDYEMWRSCVHPDDLARVEAAVQRCADPRGDGVYDTEYRVIGKTDGVERWIATRGQTNFENDVTVSFFGVALEITDRKRVERRLERRVEERTRELEETNQQLRAQMEQREIAEAESQQLQRLDAIGQITSGVAHDFNNLLSVVLTNARMLSRNLRDPGDQEGIELVLGAAERGANLTSQLLAFSRQQPLEPQVVDLNSTIVKMGGLLHASLRGAIQLRTNLAADLWPALVDPTQIQSVILNLVINARDAMRSGGTLTVETFNTIIGKELSGPAAPAPGEYVGLAIRDTGMGIPDDVLPRVFEPFFTTKGPGKGSGLGLSQVLGFAKQSGGGIALKTHVGEGTSVTVFLPCAEVAPRVRERESGAEQISAVELKPCILASAGDPPALPGWQ